SLFVLFNGLQIRLKLPPPRSVTDTLVTVFDCAMEVARPAANAAACNSNFAFLIILVRFVERYGLSSFGGHDGNLAGGYRLSRRNCLQSRMSAGQRSRSRRMNRRSNAKKWQKDGWQKDEDQVCKIIGGKIMG